MTTKLPAVVEFSEALVRKIAMDVGKEVVEHIEYAYPAITSAVAWNSARLSIRNATYNAVMTAVAEANKGAIEAMLERHDLHRRRMRVFRKAAGQKF